MTRIDRSFLVAFFGFFLLTGWIQQPHTEVGKKSLNQLLGTQEKISKKAVRHDTKRKLYHEGLRKKSKDLSEKEAKKAKEYYELLEDDEMMISMLERILAVTNNSTEKQISLLELAQAYTRLGEFKKAQLTYHQYTLMFPGARNVEYAYYYEIMVHFWDLLSSDRDQQKTRDTVQLAKNFLKEFSHKSPYTPGVHEVLKNCYIHLLNHELTIVSHYVNKYNYSSSEQTLIAATKRFERIQAELLHYLSGYDARFAALDQRVQKVLAVLIPEEKSSHPTDSVPALGLTQPGWGPLVGQQSFMSGEPHSTSSPTFENPTSPAGSSNDKKPVSVEARLEHIEQLIDDCMSSIAAPDQRPLSSRF